LLYHFVEPVNRVWSVRFVICSFTPFVCLFVA